MTTSKNQAATWLQQALDPGGERRPFPWQLALLERLFDGKAPRALDIPTGLGKTTAMAIWLVARASGAPVPRRLVYVVDRRAVVDQATSEAQRLRSWVNDSSEVRDALALESGRSLPISTLRGQFVDNREWLEDPTAPAIVLGTVDMIGSRLLFSGYGVSRKMRPYHAGLLGADTLLVLDEAHLVPAFERLVEQVATCRDAQTRSLVAESPAAQALVPPFQVMSLSATGRARGEDEVLRLGSADTAHEVVAKRLSAVKELILRQEFAEKELPDALAGEAWSLSNEGASPKRVIVFCTSRDHAQKVQEALRKRARDVVVDVELFVGGRRTHERTIAARWLEERGFIAGSKGAPQRATFVIATAAGEVGVDLDADDAVCDLVAWERMVQRFGRVNRRGEGVARVVVVPAATGDENEQGRRAAVMALLRTLSSPRSGTVDVSPGALMRLKEESQHRSLLEQASTKPLLHPPLTRALVESWSMTSLDEHTGRPEVAPWIRGWPDEPEEPQTAVVWRKHLPVTDQGELFGTKELEAFRDAAAPHLAEKVEVETWRVVEWLSARLKSLASARSESIENEPRELPLRSTDVVAVIFDPFVGKTRTLTGDALSNAEKRKAVDLALRGATLLVDARVRGLSSGLLTRDGDGDPVDQMDLTQFESGVRFRTTVVEEPGGQSQRGWRKEVAIPVAASEQGVTRWLLIESDLRQPAESEEGRSAAQQEQELEVHEKWTEAEAQRLAQRLGLPPDYAECLATAARLHDEGKKAERWQRAFGVKLGQPPLAKTTGRPNLQYLEGYRHEFGSLPDAEKHPRVKALSPELRELCLHVIAAHHGRARPLIPTSGASEPPTQLAHRAQDVALRFAVLERRWGPWGLAWWEALLRAADQRASRRNDEEGPSHG